MKEFFKILTLVKGYRLYAILNVVLNLLATFFSLFSLMMLIPVTEVLFSQGDKLKEILENPPSLNFTSLDFSLKDYLFYQLAEQIQLVGQEKVLLMVCVFLVVAILLKNLSTYFALYYIAVIRNGVVRDFRNTIYDQIVELPLAYYSDEKKGDIISRMTNDLKEVEWSVLRSLEAVFRDPINIVVFFVTLVWMSPSLTLFLIVFFPLSGFLIGVIGKSLRRSASKGQEKLGGLIAHLEETLGGLRIIKAFNAKESSKEKFKKYNEDYNQIMIKMYRKGDLASPVSEFLGITLIAVVLLYGGSLVFEGEIRSSMFITYIGLLSQLISPFKSITSAYSNAQRGLSAMDRIKEIIQAEITITDPVVPQPYKAFEEAVVYEGVSFKYGKEEVLSNINLSIPKGKMVALVGQSGAGKSTLADLLPRFYDVTEGQILIDGVNIKALKLKDLRSHLGVVTQAPILFNDTVYNNIAFGQENVTKEEIVKAAKIANAHEFILKLEDGYQTNVGDGGGSLSGGQRQRISIARAVLKNPSILILDEATSALDTESEKLVQEALNNLMKNRTSIVIAHRLSTVQHADEIVVMQDGKIVERGNHTELVALDGKYKRLTEMQSFD
ncbi:MAG: ABC transporter ATP-binding protein/permease [Flavobacteriales bacterium]|jgi:subfamily B ATP-binding cassette protein MsbA|nr:ABC transporter ATP-binding protein/permease [Flavobacteriales bacterium]